MLRVSVASGLDKGKVIDWDDVDALSVGTAENNGLVLTDPTVSRYHVELRPTQEGVVLTDLGSLNGTFSAEIRLHHAVLTSGSELRLGDTTLSLEDGELSQEPMVSAAELPGMVVESPAMQEVAHRATQLAASNLPVLIQGETGTGKELIAQAVHELSDRGNKPFEVVDCGSMAATLIASELFGHERGAFTGAHRQRKGAFERALGGTVFLDEVGELPLAVQPSLLGVLERKRFRRVGGDQWVEADVRILSATHRDLRSAVNAGSFRADLFYRLAGARILVPPLKERLEDIEPLVDHFVREATGTAISSPFGYSAMDSLRAHPWSGNIRELRNVVESALAMGSVDLGGEDVDSGPSQAVAIKDEDEDLAPYKQARNQSIAHFERTYLTRLISESEGNASEAARRAKMDRPYLLTLLRKHGLR